ncbi:MAG: inorganic diphosphatase [Deltaproteobacteria bacterium]|nr:inorganic diphosphatase [Deltaproteobacteria bacterium]
MRVPVVIEVPRFSFVKRDPKGAIDFVSPFPTPFNYGSIPGTLAEDGEPRDVLLLGPRLARGTRTEAEVLGVVRFLDAGVPDPKIVAGPHLGRRDRPTIDGFFRLYAFAKWCTGRRPTRYEGFVDARDFHEIGALLA